MEKHKPIFYTKKRQLLIILCILAQGFLQVGCSEDLYVDDATFNSKGIKISKVSLKEPRFQNKTKLIQEVNKIKNQQVLASNTNRMVYDSLKNFYFDDENGMLIENINGYESYTFKVIREAPIDSKLENVIFSKNQESSYDTYLVKYAFSEEEFKNLTQQQIENSPKIFSEIVTNNNGNSQIFSKCTAYIDCITIASPRDDGDPDGPNAIEICTYRLEGCGGGSEGSGSGSSSGTGGDSSGSSGGYGSSGSGNGSGGSGGGISTTPTPGGGSATAPPNPCRKLKDLFNASKGNIKPTILNDLRPNIAVNPSGEKGHALTKNSTGTVLGIPILPSSINVTQAPTGGYFFCVLHTHPLDTYPMFSFSDVLTLNSLNNGSASFNQGMASFLLVCQDDNGVFQTYAIVIDPDSINESIDQFMSNPENIGCTRKEIKDKMNERLEVAYNKEYNSPNPNYEKVFLKNMFYTNVSLYKANSTLTNWSKLSISSNTTNPTINSTPCN